MVEKSSLVWSNSTGFTLGLAWEVYDLAVIIILNLNTNQYPPVPQYASCSHYQQQGRWLRAGPPFQSKPGVALKVTVSWVICSYPHLVPELHQSFPWHNIRQPHGHYRLSGWDWRKYAICPGSSQHIFYKTHGIMPVHLDQVQVVSHTWTQHSIPNWSGLVCTNPLYCHNTHHTVSLPLTIH